MSLLLIQVTIYDLQSSGICHSIQSLKAYMDLVLMLRLGSSLSILPSKVFFNSFNIFCIYSPVGIIQNKGPKIVCIVLLWKLFKSYISEDIFTEVTPVFLGYSSDHLFIQSTVLTLSKGL